MSTLSRRALAGLAAVLAGGAGAVAVASPAAAVITDRVVVSATTASTTDGFKQINALCPDDMAALGGGSLIISNDRYPHLTASGPTAVSDGHVSRAEAHLGGLTPWRLRDYTVCGNGVTGREVVWASGTIGAGVASGSVSVPCPKGKRVIGMGGYVSADDFILSAVDVNSSLTSATMSWGRAYDVPDALTGLAEVWAVCINPVSGLERVRVVSPTDTADKSVVAACPSGKRVYDVGGGVSSIGARRSAKIDALVPATTTATVGVRELKVGHSGPWAAFATIICAP